MTATLHHAGVTVPDLDAAVAFFTEQFGARVLFRLGPVAGDPVTRLGADGGSAFELAMLRMGDARLELLRWSPSSGGPAPADSGAAVHIGVEVSDVDATLERLRAVPGVRVLGEPVSFHDGPTPGMTNAFCTTPWGALVELLGWQGNEATR